MAHIVRVLLGLALGSAPLVAAAGDPERSVDRLRARLDDFRVVGDGPGESLVAGWRRDDVGMMKWADATVAHGWYLGQLATGRALAVREGADVEALTAELALALGAVERVDRVAESGFPDPCTSTEDLNGFFVRDDVPSDFGSRFEGISLIQSDWVDPAAHLKEMSQDQVHHILLGLALVKRYVPEEVEVDGRSLSAWAVELAVRILEWVEHDGWVIRNPACASREVARGANAELVSPGFAAVYRWFTDGEADLPSAEAYADAWALSKVPPPGNPAYFNPDNLHMVSVTTAIGGAFGDDTLSVLHDLAEQDDWVAYPLVHVVLHGDVEGWSELRDDLLERAADQLTELPDDAEPRGYPEGEVVEHGWTSWHRYIRPAEQHYAGDAGREGQRYSGIDYLLLHDLAALAEDPIVPDEDAPDDASPQACGCVTVPPASTAGGLLLAVPWWLRRRRCAAARG